MKMLAMPMAIIISSLFISLALLFGFNGFGNWFGMRGSVVGTTVSAGSGNAAAAATTTSAATAPTGGEASAVTQDQVVALAKANGNIVLGNKDAKLVITEFSDPSCPFCHIASGKNGALNTSVGAQFTLVADGGKYVAPVPEFRKLVESGKAAYTFMYSNGHGNGRVATQALYCANEQGKFWDVHDMLFTAAGYSIINDVVKNDVTKAGAMADFLVASIDKNFMKSCLESNKYDAKLTSDESIAVQFGVQGTPGYFINTRKFAGAFSYKDMEAMINAAI